LFPPTLIDNVAETAGVFIPYFTVEGFKTCGIMKRIPLGKQRTPENMTPRALARAILLVFFLTGSARAGRLTKEIHFAEPAVKGVPGGVLVTIPGCRSIGNPGEPILPVYPARFLIPPGETVVRVLVEESRLDTLDGAFDVLPMPPQAPIGAAIPPEPVRSEAIYRSSAPVPAVRAALATEQTMDGVRVAFIDVYPCACIPASRAIVFAPSIRVTIETVPAPVQAARAGAARIRRAMHVLTPLVENPDVSPAYLARAASLEISAPASELAHYVIITSPALAAAFEPLAELETRFGRRTRIVDTDSIAAAFPGPDLPAKIRSFITFAYENWQTEYVLLGGDDEIVPHRGLYVKNGTYIDPDIPSDLYYSCLDGTWNSDGDAYYGEPGEEDLLSEVIVGRLPVDSPAEAAAAIAKIAAYSLSPVRGRSETAAMLGELLWSAGGVDTWGGDYKDEVLHGSSSWGFTTAGLPARFSVETLYDRDAGSWTKAQVLSVLNGGVNLVNHCGHSNLYSVMRLATADVPLLTNDGVSAGFFVCWSHGCFSAAFDNRDDAGTQHAEDCIGEELVTGPHGAAAFIGNTRYGWDAPGSTCGASQFFDRRFFDAIFGDGVTRLGDALEISRLDNVSYISFDAVRWVYYELCLFGDPAMSVWTAEPRELSAVHDSVLFAGENDFEVRVSDEDGPLSGARVSLSSNEPALYCAAVTDGSGEAFLRASPPPGGSALLSVVAPNHYLRTDTLAVVEPAAVLPSISIAEVRDDPPAGDGDGVAEPGDTLALDISVRNAGVEPLANAAISLSCPDTAVAVLSGALDAGTVGPGEEVTFDGAFTVAIGASAHGGPAPLVFDVTAAGGSWKIPCPLPVSAPHVALESWSISDIPRGDGDGCIEAWEFESLVCEYRNSGTTDVIHPVLTLSFAGGSWGRAVKGTADAPAIPAGGTLSFPNELLWFIDEFAPPFSTISLVLTLEADNIPASVETLRVRTCGTALSDHGDAEEPIGHHAIVGMDQWHLTTERCHSTPSSWKCGGAPGDVYANMTESALALPPLCLFENSRLTFWHRMTAEAGTTYPYWALDAGVVEISTDDGETWTIISPAVMYPSRASPYNTIFLPAYQRCYSGTIDWREETFDLSAYHGPALIRFHFASDEQYGYEGWYIDDIAVTTDVPTGTGGGPPAPRPVSRLLAPYPNPFNPRTLIPFETAGRGRVALEIFDASGRLVRTLVDARLDRGPHAVSWDARDNRGRPLASGIYFVRLTAGAYAATTRLVLVR
jgi:hypothetical protein